MNTPDPETFFVGYVDGVATSTRRHLARWIALALLVVVTAGGAAAALQNESRAGLFEFGVVRSFAGWVDHTPHPVLVVPHTDGSADTSRYLLTAFGKSGADHLFDADDANAWYTFDGTLVLRDGHTMVEVAAGTVRATAPPEGRLRPASETVDLGTVTLRGEIVDSKCFLGVMKPGNAKSHRACAVRCISGGVPPVLLVRDTRGYATYYLLVDEDGGAINERVLALVALPVSITGELERHGDLFVLRADPDTFEVLVDG